MSVISGIIGALQQRQAAKDAANANRQNTIDTNDLNRRMWEESRGGAGSAVLPSYLRTPSGATFESSVLGPELMRNFTDTGNISPADYGRAIGRFSGAQAGADQAVNDIFSGETTNKYLSNFAPVAAARTAYTRDSAATALAKTLNDIEATQARRGFTGDSMGNRLLRYNANLGAAQATAGANLQNRLEEQGIRNRGIELPLANLNLPYAQMQRATDILNLPSAAAIDMLSKRLAPLSFLNIHTSSPFTYAPLPTVQPIASPLGLIAQGAAGTGNAALDLYLKRLAAQGVNRSGSVTAPYGPNNDYLSGFGQDSTFAGAPSVGLGVGADQGVDNIDWSQIAGTG